MISRCEEAYPVRMMCRLLIGGRYLTFQTLYGLRAYRVLGSVL